MSVKKKDPAEILDCIESIVSLERIATLTILSFLIHEHSTCLNLFQSSFFHQYLLV